MPDPLRLATFYSAILGLPVTYQDQPPRWPDPNFPQQLHLDIMVEDVAQAESEVLALGATPLPGTSATARVYTDPAGHPFCLIPRPGWSAPIHPTTDAT